MGIFDVNGAHNGVHLATGIIGMMSDKASKSYFQIFGVVYALVAVLGFFMGNQPPLGIVSTTPLTRCSTS